MDKKIKGAWLIQHGRKLESTLNQDFDTISFSGKCGLLLSAISADSQHKLTLKRVEALAKANRISPRTELPAILIELKRQRLISTGGTELEVLGITGHSILDHTATIFDESSKEGHEEAVLHLSEQASELPLKQSEATIFISDTFHLTADQAKNTIEVGSEIGFFDAEAISHHDKLLFNGNLFRRDQAKKIEAVLASLSDADARLVVELNERLKARGCLPIESVYKILGKVLFPKLHSIGMLDVNMVGNESGKSYFITRPAAFSKFTNSIVDDALDLAKALVASLTYRMTQSSYYRGRIQMVSALMTKLINGGTVGPATAIGSDYQALEFRGVVTVSPAQNGMFNMRLLKPEVGKLALAVIQDGDITAESVAQLPGAKVTEYSSPESNREIMRRESAPGLKESTRNLLNEIRTGGISK